MSLDRRTTLRWAGAVAIAAGTTVGGLRYFTRDRPAAAVPTAKGYGKDPALTAPRRDVWPLTLSDRQRAAATTLADIYLPGDPAATPPCPPASALDIAAFFDEWLSAPYPAQRTDHELLMPLLDAVATAPSRSSVILRDPIFQAAAARFRILATAAYYTTPQGLTAIGFVGNEPRENFDGPPPELAQRFEEAFAKLKT